MKHLCHILFCQLGRIGKISFSSTDTANKLAVSLIVSRFDYCHFLLAGIPDNKMNKLQRIQNRAARLVLCKSSSQRAQRSPRAPPPHPPLPGTFHSGPKMCLRVSRTQSHLFPGQPLGCTGVVALCARILSCVQRSAD